MRFQDWDQLSDDLKPIVEYLVQQELISGYPDGTEMLVITSHNADIDKEV